MPPKPAAFTGDVGDVSTGFDSARNPSPQPDLQADQVSGSSPDSSGALEPDPVKNQSTQAGDEKTGAPRRPKRRRRRSKAERGLPTDENLRKLAEGWLTNQRRLWPELVQRGRRPEVSDEVLDGMARQFKRMFLTGTPAPFAAQLDAEVVTELAAAYVRYSDDKSNPQSLDDHLYLQMERARRDGRFIPWVYVCADASVSGTGLRALVARLPCMWQNLVQRVPLQTGLAPDLTLAHTFPQHPPSDMCPIWDVPVHLSNPGRHFTSRCHRAV